MFSSEYNSGPFKGPNSFIIGDISNKWLLLCLCRVSNVVVVKDKFIRFVCSDYLVAGGIVITGSNSLIINIYCNMYQELQYYKVG